MGLKDVTEFIKLIPDSCSVMQICCTDKNTFVLTTSGKIYSWGELTYALGRRPQEDKDLIRPMLLYKIEHENIVCIACGTNHVLALSSNKTLYSWGDNTFGQLGHGDTLNRIEPEKIKEIQNVIRISAGNEYSFALMEKEDSDRSVTILSFVWGNNNNIKLRKVNDEEQTRSIVPIKVLQPAWGTENPQISIKSDKRSKNYAYKSVLTNEVEMGNLTKADVKVIQTENNHLLRKFEILSNKAKLFEDSVYKCDLSAKVEGINEDEILASISDILKDTESEKEIDEVDIERKNNEKGEIKNRISEIESFLKELQKKEEESRENIERIEDDIKFFDYDNDKNTEEGKKNLAFLRNSVLAATEEFSKICDEKTKQQKGILEENDKVTKISEEIRKLKKKCKNAGKRIGIFKKIKEIRKEQLIYNFFEHSQKAVNKEIDNMQSIYDTVKDSEVEALSKNLQRNNLNDYLDYSQFTLDQLLSEIELMKKPLKPSKRIDTKSFIENTKDQDMGALENIKKANKLQIFLNLPAVANLAKYDSSADVDEKVNFVYRKLNIIWNALEKYILLVKEKNSLIYGLVQETVNEVCNQPEAIMSEDEHEEIGDKRKLMKKILKQSKVAKTMAEMETKKEGK